MVRNIKEIELSIIDLLVKKGKINRIESSHILLNHSNNEMSLLEILYEQSVISQNELIDLYSEYFNIDIIDLSLLNDDIKNVYSIDNKDYTTDVYSRNGYFLCKHVSKGMILVVTDVSKIYELLPSSYPIYLSYRDDFYKILDSNFRSFNSLYARYFLHYISPNVSSKDVSYKSYILIFCFVFLWFFLKHPTCFYLVNNLIFIMQNLFKCFLIIFSNKKNKEVNLQRSDFKIYPYYTILLPVYKELIQLPNLVKNISNLKYPKSRLDVKLIVEEDDTITIKALQGIYIPDYFHIVKVPYSLPRTKPKALNYAMQYAKGEYLVIYDAEDRPEEDQLLKALDMFSKLPAEYICLQAKLNYYNKNENILTKLFSLEYKLWFDFFLEGLAFFNFPITLGGTSNHFKTKYLRDIYGWDSHNVTEDAELGIRIYLNNYKTAILNSHTLEESPITCKNWLFQRSRWIKGYIQTFLVYIKNRKYALPLLGFAGFVSVFIFVGCVTYSFVLLPWICIIFYSYNYDNLALLGEFNICLAILYMYLAFYFVYKHEKIYIADLMLFITWPFYFILHTIASYNALYELIAFPFRWNKTIHGVSNLLDHELK